MKKAGYILSTLLLGLFVLAFSSNVYSQSITVTAPTGAAVWQKGTTQNITWTTSGVTGTFWIELWKTGVKVGDVNSNVSGTSYSYFIPTGLTTGADYQIKVFSNPLWIIYGTSPVFSIVDDTQPYITVVSPVSTDHWEIGVPHTISWTDNLSSNVQIDLMDVTGATVLQSLGAYAGTSYIWTIPASFSINPAGYKIRLSNINDPTTNTLSALFHITANSQTITSVTFAPTGNYVQRQTNQTISWAKDFSENVNVYLVKYPDSTGSAADSTGLISANVYGTTTNWYVSDIQTLGYYKIKVRSVLYNQDTAGKFLFSAHYFAVVPTGGNGGGRSITVNTPALTPIQPWAYNQLHTISWTKTNIPENVDIELWHTSGTKVSTICTNIWGSSYNWFIPASMQFGNYTLKFFATGIPGVVITSRDFQITDANGNTNFTVALTAPLAGVTCQTGTLLTITWTKNFSENVNLFYADGDFHSNKTSIMADVYGYLFNWWIPNAGSISRGPHSIIVEREGFPGIHDSIAININSSSPTGTLTLLAPLGGTVIPRGTITQISWNKSGVDENVRIELWKGTSSLAMEIIKTSQPGVACDWYIPDYLPAGIDYYIKVMSVLDPSIICQGTNFKIAIYKSFGVYPNPSDNGFNVNLDESAKGNYDMVVYNRLGLKVLTTTLNADASKELSVSTANLPSGVYYVVLTSGEERITKSVVVQH